RSTLDAGARPSLRWLGIGGGFMRAAILEKPQQLVIQDLPDPTPPPGGVVLKIKAALTCGTDVKTYLRGHPMIPLPSPLGHEFAGVVTAVGDGHDKFAVGDEVMAVHSAPCNECFYCRQDLHNLCESIMDTKVLGAFANQIALPAHIVAQNAYLKPEMITFAQAAFLEPLSCVVHGARLARAALGETVVVLGAGPIGLLFTMLLRAEGCHTTIIEPREKRREMAARLGADQVFATGEEALPVVKESTGGYGADLVIECTGQLEAWVESLQYLRRGGRVLLFGGVPSGSQVRFETDRLHYDQIQVMSSFHFTPADVALAADLLVSDQIDPAPLITGSTRLDGLSLSFKLLSQGEGVKVLVHP
ncbi:MAG: zinc-binding dehydrogenase, partial [Alphaproteobacteria bacterium]